MSLDPTRPPPRGEGCDRRHPTLPAMSATPPPPPPAPPPWSPVPSQHGLTGPGGHVLAPAWKRIAARLLDIVILGLLFGSFFAAIVLGDNDGAGFGGVGADASFGELYQIALFSAAIGFVWDAVCTKSFGGTPMKLAFGMRVVQAGDGAPVEWKHAIIRWAIPGAIGLLPIGLIGSLVNLVIVVVSLVFLFTHALRQTVWDQAAKTIVIDARPNG